MLGLVSLQELSFRRIQWKTISLISRTVVFFARAEPSDDEMREIDNELRKGIFLGFMDLIDELKALGFRRLVFVGVHENESHEVLLFKKNKEPLDIKDHIMHFVEKTFHSSTDKFVLRTAFISQFREWCKKEYDLDFLSKEIKTALEELGFEMKLKNFVNNGGMSRLEVICGLMWRKKDYQKILLSEEAKNTQ